MQLLFICREIITALSNMAQSIHLRFCPSLPSPSDTALFQGNGQLFSAHSFMDSPFTRPALNMEAKRSPVPE